jgi:dephospho-CoA kinase
LTGGIGSGKSTASRYFAELGIPVIDADQVARDMVNPGMPALAAIREDFGPEVIGADGQLDRARLRDRVFTEPAARTRLEFILHPLIRSEIRRRTDALSAPYCIIAIPLLVESGWQGEVDRVSSTPTLAYSWPAPRPGMGWAGALLRALLPPKHRAKPGWKRPTT